MSNFYPLEVVARGSETQLQVGENLDLNNFRSETQLQVGEKLNYTPWRVKGQA